MPDTTTVPGPTVPSPTVPGPAVHSPTVHSLTPSPSGEDDRRPRVLFVAPWVPSERRPRSLALLRHLRAVADVRCVVTAWDALDRADAARLDGDVVVVHARPAAGVARAGLGLLRGASLQQAYADAPAVRRAIRREVAAFHPDVAYFNVIRSAQWFDEVGDLPVVHDLDEVRSDYYRQRASRATGPARLVAHVEARRMAAAERRAAARATTVLVSSPVDAGHARPGQVVVLRSEHVMSAASWTEHDAVPGRLLFVGRLGYDANVEALEWFVAHVLPLLRQRGTGARLRVVGAEAGPRVERLVGPDVELVGRVPDVGVEYAAAQAVVVPVRTATGVQMKLIEALSVGSPTVSTPVCAQLAGAGATEACLVADTPAQWADAIERVLASPDVRAGLSAAGRAWTAAAYGGDTAATLRDVLAAARRR